MRSGEKAISEPDASGTERGNRARVTGVTRRVFFQAAATPLATVALAGLSRAAGHLSFPRRQGSGALGPAVGSGGDDVAHESGSERVWSPVLESQSSMGIAETSLTPAHGVAAPGAGRGASRPPAWDAQEL